MEVNQEYDLEMTMFNRECEEFFGHTHSLCITAYCYKSSSHTLPNWDQIYSISEVIILNNDQHQHQKTISTYNRISSKIKQQHTTFVDWCYGLREVLFDKVWLFVVYKVVLHGKQFLAK